MDDYNNEDVYTLLSDTHPEWMQHFSQPFDDNIELPDPIQIEWGNAVLDEPAPLAFSQDSALTDTDIDDRYSSDFEPDSIPPAVPTNVPPPLAPDDNIT